MRQDITFISQGLKCSGRLYLPDDLRSGEKRPAIVMAHGFSAVTASDVRIKRSGWVNDLPSNKEGTFAGASLCS